MSRPFLGWATGFYDFDHDGDEDLLVFNGHVYPTATPRDDGLDVPPDAAALRARGGALRARAAATAPGPWLAEAHVDRSAAFGDLDGDGDVDVVVGELNGPVRVLENDGARGALAVGRAGRTAAPASATATAWAAASCCARATTAQTRWIVSGGSFQAASAPVAHFGLPDRRSGLARGHVERRDRADGRAASARVR